MTNAVLHAAPPFELLVALDSEAVELGVRDGGRRPLFRTMADGSSGRDQLSESGRGLRIIEALSAEFGESLLPDGKVVWCRLAPPGQSKQLRCGCPVPTRAVTLLPSGRAITPLEEPAER